MRSMSCINPFFKFYLYINILHVRGEHTSKSRAVEVVTLFQIQTPSSLPIQCFLHRHRQSRCQIVLRLCSHLKAPRHLGQFRWCLMEISQQFDPNTRIQCVSGARGLHGQAVRKRVEKGIGIVTEHVPALLFVYLLINKNKMMFSFT